MIWFYSCRGRYRPMAVCVCLFLDRSSCVVVAFQEYFDRLRDEWGIVGILTERRCSQTVSAAAENRRNYRLMAQASPKLVVGLVSRSTWIVASCWVPSGHSSRLLPTRRGSRLTKFSELVRHGLTYSGVTVFLVLSGSSVLHLVEPHGTSEDARRVQGLRLLKAVIFGSSTFYNQHNTNYKNQRAAWVEESWSYNIIVYIIVENISNNKPGG